MKSLTHWTPLSGSIIVLFITMLVIAPVYLTQYPPLNDYPWHLARIIILSDLDSPVYSEFYKAGSFLLPNMAMDMVAIPLANLVGPENASRIFVALSLLSVMFGIMMLHKAAHKRFSPWPLLAVALLFNAMFRYGFLNYIFGMGIAFFAAGVWLLIKSRIRRIIFTLLMSLLLIMLHFAAFGIFAVIVGSVEIHNTVGRWRQKGFKTSISHLINSAIPFLIATSLFLLLSPTAEVTSSSIIYPSSRSDKPLAAIYSLLTGITWLDIVFWLSLISSTLYLYFTKRLNFSPSLILAMVMMMLAYIVLPGTIKEVHFVYIRLAPAIALLGIAAIDIKSNDIHTDRLVAILAVLLALTTSTGLTYEWHKFNQKTAEIIKTFDSIETGATVFSATAQPYTRLITNTPERHEAWQPPLKHVSSYAILSGPKFVPMTFAHPTMQPLNVSDKYQNVKAFQGDNPRKTFSGPALEKFLLSIREHLTDGSWPPLKNIYVFVMGFDRIEHDFNREILTGWANISKFHDDHILINLSP